MTMKYIFTPIMQYDIKKKNFSFTNIFLFTGEIINFYQHKEVKVSYHL